jgi:hypothetical protein
MGKVKEKRSFVLNSLITMFKNMGLECPINIDEITDYVMNNIDKNVNTIHYVDVTIGFKQWIESKTKVNEYPYGMKDALGKQITIGSVLTTVKEVRYLLEELNDNDLVVIESCDEKGNAQDLYPMSIDVIENIQLTDGSMVNEVRFCQRPNTINSNTPVFLNKIDWKSLREQKQTILGIISWNKMTLLNDSLDGIVNLIDAIQDYAVDNNIADETTVFGENKE